MTPRRPKAGVTLLEVVIAVSLLSLLMAGVMTSLRMGLSALDRTNTRLMANRRVAGAQQALQQQLEGFMPVVALYAPSPDLPPTMRMPFFQGEPQSMRFVSSYSLQEGTRGRARILEFQVIPGEGGKGVRLVVNEQPYTGPRSAGFFCLGPSVDGFRFRPIEIGARSFVLADRLAFCRFSHSRKAPWHDRGHLDRSMEAALLAVGDTRRNGPARRRNFPAAAGKRHRADSREPESDIGL